MKLVRQTRFSTAPWQLAYNAAAVALFPDAFWSDGQQIRLLTADEHRACVDEADRVTSKA